MSGDPRMAAGWDRLYTGGMRTSEDAARELPNLSLEDALQLIRLYADQGSPKFQKAALRWLERYAAEGSSTLSEFAIMAANLAELDLECSAWQTSLRSPTRARPRLLAFTCEGENA
jgi:hypothetical protein